jgi:hypothetical protein
MSLDLGGANVMIDLTRNRAKDKQAFLKKRFFVSHIEETPLQQKVVALEPMLSFQFFIG